MNSIHLYNCNHFDSHWSIVDAGCGGALTADTGIIISPNYPNPYNHNQQCIWTIQVPTTEVITFTITDLLIEESTNCDFDYVEVRNGEILSNDDSGGGDCGGGDDDGSSSRRRGEEKEGAEERVEEVPTEGNTWKIILKKNSSGKSWTMNKISLDHGRSWKLSVCPVWLAFQFEQTKGVQALITSLIWIPIPKLQWRGRRRKRRQQEWMERRWWWCSKGSNGSSYI